MSTTTTNLELVKPAGNERVDIDVINGNYDKIDEFAGLAITDANYVHTDNNYTTTEKDKLSAIQPNATATSFSQTLVSGTAVGTITINGTSYTIYAPTASGGASALNDLTDVTLASPSNGQVLKYNSTTGKWENANESGGGGGYIPTGESYRFNLDGSVASSNLALSVQWTDGESTQVAWVCTYSQISTGWTTGDYKNITINWDSSNQNFNFVAKSGSFECNESYFDEGDTMGTLASGNITFLAVEKTEVSVDWTQVQLSGTKIAEIEIDGVSQNVYAPTPPTNTSDLTNDSNFVADASYVHTDNNYTLTEKNKLSGLVEVEANPSGTASTDLTKIAIGGTNYNIPSGGSGSSTFAGLSDVDIDDTTLANGQVPVWNSTTEKWENGAGGGGTTVVPNPQGTPTGELLAIQIGNDIYSLPEGESEHLLNDILTGPDATKATASSTSQDGAIWKAFDGVKTGTEQSCWIPEYGSTNCWICYHFATPKYITKCHVYFYENMSGTYTGAVKIQGSNDGETWTDISQSQALSMTRGVHDYEIESTDIVNGYSYVRMFSETALVVYGSASACTLELEIYGRDNASGTTVIPNPEGEATDTLNKIQIGNDIYEIPQGGSGGGGGYTEVSGTLTAGQTEIALVDSSIRQSSTIEPFTDKFGVNPTNMVVTTGDVVLQPLVSQESELTVTVTASSTFSNYPAWQAFLNSDVDGWVAMDADTDCSLTIEFPTAQQVDKLEWHCQDPNRDQTVTKIQYSSDGTTWEDCTLSTNNPCYVEISDSVPAKYWKMCFGGPYSQYAAPMVSKLELISLGLGTLTLTFPAQSENLGVKVRITNGEGGVGSLDYSTEEQDTGIKWIDGSTVYQKSYTGTIGYSGPTVVEADFHYNIIGAESWFRDTAGRGIACGDLNTSGWMAAVHVTDINHVLSLVTYTGSALSGGTYFITIKYTKPET